MAIELAKTSVVIPCHNERHRLPVQELSAYLSENAWMHFCFVDDGSTDGTIEMLNRIRQEFNQQTLVIQLETNRGKGEAVRTGMLESLIAFQAKYVGYLDADLATPLCEMERLVRMAEGTPGAVMFSACRLRRLGARIERKWWRHYLGRAFASAASLAIDLPAYDSQCGAKIFRSEVVQKVFSKEFMSRWAFDAEIFVRVVQMLGRKKTLNAIVEVPLSEWKDKGGSKLTFRHSLTAVFDLCRIFRLRRRI
jgi:dolichyl-phosphate beta-glucosyltransferase